MPEEPYPIKIIGLTLEAPDQLLAYPGNPKIHPQAQSETLDAAMREFGVLAPALQNDVTGHLLDGHKRIELALSNGQAAFPVLHVEVPEEQEGAVVATFDPIGFMAIRDQGMLDQLIDEAEVKDERLAAFMATLRSGSIDLAAEWQGMPEFQQDDQSAMFQAHVNFASEEDLKAFEKLVGQSIPKHTKSIWFPPIPHAQFKDLGYVSES